LDRRPGGVAIVPTTDRSTPEYQIRPLQEHGIPVVFCHRGVKGIRAPLLPIQFAEVGRRAGQALVQQGHRRVAFFSPNPSPLIYSPYEAGFRDAVEAVGGELPRKFVFQGPNVWSDIDTQEQAFLEGLQRMCRGPDRPTAIFTTYDPTAEMIYLLLERLGLRVPQDISLLSEGDRSRQGAIARKLSSVIVEEEEIGRQAARLLCQMRDGERAINDKEEIVVPLGFYEGQTLGPPPAEIRALEP
jgi:GntR family transcriptional regulator, arabinose operon transcriptional repressor